MQAPSLEARLRNIVEALTFDVYNYTCLSLFECHKLMFSFQVSRAVSCPELQDFLLASCRLA